MSWADNYIKMLKEGRTIDFRPRGNSMTPLIKSGQLVTLIPVAPESKIEVGDIVLCKVYGTQYLHKVIAIREDRYQIGNNKGKINGWTTKSNIFGKCVYIND